LAFWSCKSISKITIPKSVKEIGYGILRECDNLSQILVDKYNTRYDSRDNCNAIIETSTNRLLVGCKDTKVPDSVTKIGYFAFRDCHKLTVIDIPNSVDIIERFAFYGCAKLSRITIPDSVTILGEGSFSGCKSLDQIQLPQSIRKIGAYAFEGCSSLKDVSIPLMVSALPVTFKNCTNLSRVTICGKVNMGGTFIGCKLLEEIIFKNPCVKVSTDTFDGCDNIKRIIIPENSLKRFQSILPERLWNSIYEENI
jgi:hypothetical protein